MTLPPGVPNPGTVGLIWRRDRTGRGLAMLHWWMLYGEGLLVWALLDRLAALLPHLPLLWRGDA